MAWVIEIGDMEAAIDRTLLSTSPTIMSTVVSPSVIPTAIESEQDNQTTGEETPVASTSAAATTNRSRVKIGVTCNSGPSGNKRLKATRDMPRAGSSRPQTVKTKAKNIPISNDARENDSGNQPASTNADHRESSDNVASHSASARALAPELVGNLPSTTVQDVERVPKGFEYHTRSTSGKFPMTSGSPITSISFEDLQTIKKAIVSTTVDEIVLDKYDVNLFLKRIKKHYKNHDSWNLTVKSMKWMSVEERKGTLFEDTELLDACMKDTYWLRKVQTINGKFNTYEAIRRFPGLKNYYQTLLQIKKEYGRRNSVVDVQKIDDAIKSQLLQLDSCRIGCKHSWCDEAAKIIGAAKRDTDKTFAARLLLYICEKSDKTGALKIFNFIGKADVIDGMDSLSAREKTALKAPRLQPSINLNGGLETIYGRCSVSCDGQEILADVSFWEAVFAVYYLFYVFHIQYTELDKKLFKEFDKIAKDCRNPIPTVLMLRNV